MKVMGLKSLIYGVLITFVLFVISLMVLWWEHSAREETSLALSTLQQDAHEYTQRKKRISLEESKKEVDLLSSHPNLIRQEKRGSGYVMEFNRLSSDEFDRLSNLILNSKMVIKKLNLRKGADSKGEIVVEFES